MLLASIAMLVLLAVADGLVRAPSWNYGVRTHRVRAHSHLETLDLPSAAEGFAEWWDDTDDEITGRTCAVEGTIPQWLRGRLVRNGPGKWTAGDGSRTYTHAFDGLAKLVSFELADDGVRFSTRFLRSNWYERASLGPIPPSVTTGPVDPPWSVAEGVTAALTGTAFDNTPVNLHCLGGGGERWVAVTDAPVMTEFDPATLETLGRVDETATPIAGLTSKLGLQIPGFEAFSTAHPQRHPGTGETLNYHLELRPVGGPVAHIVASSAATRSGAIERRILGSVELERIGIDGIPCARPAPLTCMVGRGGAAAYGAAHRPETCSRLSPCRYRAGTCTPSPSPSATSWSCCTR